jgi:hypothetical protein
MVARQEAEDCEAQMQELAVEWDCDSQDIELPSCLYIEKGYLMKGGRAFK